MYVSNISPKFCFPLGRGVEPRAGTRKLCCFIVVHYISCFYSSHEWRTRARQCVELRPVLVHVSSREGDEDAEHLDGRDLVAQDRARDSLSRLRLGARVERGRLPAHVDVINNSWGLPPCNSFL